MSANGTRLIVWAGGEHQFCLAKVGHILDLERTCDAGIAVIFTRLGSGTWRLNDVRETIRLGLIGGDMPPDKAMEKVQNFVDGQPLASSVLLAYSIIEAVLVGVKDDPVGRQDDDPSKKEQPAEATETGSIFTTTTDASDVLQ